jgi:hypothetical protein
MWTRECTSETCRVLPSVLEVIMDGDGSETGMVALCMYLYERQKYRRKNRSWGSCSLATIITAISEFINPHAWLGADKRCNNDRSQILVADADRISFVGTDVVGTDPQATFFPKTRPYFLLYWPTNMDLVFAGGVRSYRNRQFHPSQFWCSTAMSEFHPSGFTHHTSLGTVRRKSYYTGLCTSCSKIKQVLRLFVPSPYGYFRVVLLTPWGGDTLHTFPRSGRVKT